MEIKNTYTRRIDREYNRILLTNSKTSSSATWWIEINIDPFQLQVANDYLIKSLYWIDEKQLDLLEMEEYDTMLFEANKAKDFLSKKTS